MAVAADDPFFSLLVPACPVGMGLTTLEQGAEPKRERADVPWWIQP